MRLAWVLILGLFLGCAVPQPSEEQVEADFAYVYPDAQFISLELVSREVGAADLEVHFTTLGGVPESVVFRYVQESSGAWRLAGRPVR